MNEFERPQPRYPELAEYYRDITTCEFSSLSVPKVEQLLAATPFEHDITIELLHEKGLLPSDYRYYYDSRVATDWLTILPITTIGSALEQSPQPVERMAAWYEEAAQHLKAVALQNGYSDECYEHYYDMYACDQSEVCPLRIIEGVLSDDVVLRTRTEPAGAEDEIRKNLLTGMKLAAGYSAGIFSYDSYQMMLNRHEATINARSDSAAN